MQNLKGHVSKESLDKEIDMNKCQMIIIANIILNTRHKNNFKIYDNYDNELDFDMLQTFLMRNGLTYGDFNAAWFYIEEDFNNKSYS